MQDIVLNIIFMILAFIIVLVPLIAIHELGHLLFSRLFGVKIPEFGIGIPLTRHRISRKWKGITWSLYPWLIGGFVRIHGDQCALDEAYEEYKKSPDAARKEYIPNRYHELIFNQDLEEFLRENNLDYDEEWKKFHDLAISQKTLTDSSFLSKKDTLETLIEWEFDAKISSKDKRAVKDTFFAKNWLQQSLIVFGGIIFNFLTAFIIFVAVFGSFGNIPSTVYTNSNGDLIPYYKVKIEDERQRLGTNGRIEQPNEGLTVFIVNKGEVADKLGLVRNDRLLELAGQDLKNLQNPEDLNKIIKDNAGKTVTLVYIDNKNNQTVQKDVTIPSENPRLGIGAGYTIVKKANGFWGAIVMGFNETIEVTVKSFEALGRLAQSPFVPEYRNVIDQTSGPIQVSALSVGIFRVFGIGGILYLIALISIGLAVMNMLPIPALDGGRFVMLSLNKILGKRNKRVEAIAISATFVLLIALSVLIAIKDINSLGNIFGAR
jgi:regulator of sigma E protease